MKKETHLSKTEQKLEYLILFIGILSFCVIALGVYYQNKKINKDYLLVLILSAIYIIIFGIYAYNGLRGGNLIKRWTPFFIYDIVLWIVSKFSTDNEKAEKLTNKIIIIKALLMCGLFLFIIIKILITKRI